MTHQYIGTKYVAIDKKTSLVGEFFPIEVTVQNVEDKFTVVQLFEKTDNPGKMCVASIPFPLNIDHPVTETNWLVRILQGKTVPVVPRNVTLSVDSKYLWTFDEFTIMFSMGYYFLNFKKYLNNNDNFIVAVKDPSVSVEMMRPLPSELMFEYPEEYDNIDVGYTQSRLLVVAKKSGDPTATRVLKLKFGSEVSLGDALRIYLSNKNIDISPYVLSRPAFSDSHHPDEMYVSSYVDTLGRTLFRHARSLDGLFKLCFRIEDWCGAVGASLNSISQFEEFQDKLGQFTEEFNDLLSEENKHSKIIKHCLKYM